MNVTRRTILAATPAAALAACAGQTTTQLQSDVNAIDTGLQSVVTDLAATPGVSVPATTMAEIKTTLDNIHTDAAQIAAVAAPSQTAVQVFSDTVSALVPLLTPFFPQVPAVAATVQAAVTLVQVVIAQVSPSKVAAVDPAQAAYARLVLRGAALRAS